MNHAIETLRNATKDLRVELSVLNRRKAAAEAALETAELRIADKQKEIDQHKEALSALGVV